MTASLASALPSVAAQEADKYPYVLFASNNKEGAITVNAQSFNVNGNIATNGTVSKNGNMNLNGMKSENIGESMPFFVDKIEEVYFSGEYEFYTEDYILVETNVNLSKPIKVQGNYTLDGNINSSSALMAQNNIHIEGNTINANNSVLCAQYGNISIDCSNVNISGLIYAPMGTVEITAENISLNSVVVIADEIVLEANNVNVGYSSWAGQLVGTEFTETPDDEIDYEKDTDEDGIPDFIEEEFGTDINSSDTDNDGLSDLFELVNGITDPTIPDSDGNGISDGDEDYDGDGLTNIQEYIQETDPCYNEELSETKCITIDTMCDEELASAKPIENYNGSEGISLFAITATDDVYSWLISVYEFKAETRDVFENLEDYFEDRDLDLKKTLTTSDKESTFVDRWNQAASSGKTYEVFVVNCHANPTQMYNGLTRSDVRNLKKLDCKCLILLGCNAGHYDYLWENLAFEFAKKVTGVVVASDGTVQSGWANVFGLNMSFLSVADKSYTAWFSGTTYRKNYGWVIYNYDPKTRTMYWYGTGIKTITMKKVLDYLEDKKLADF